MLSRLKFDIEPLVNEILDQLPADVWTSETTTFFDPAIGGGQFLREIESRLRKVGHSDSNINGRVYGCEDSEHRVQYAKNKYKLAATLGVGDFLEKDFTTMKFDVIVGNPPYQPPKKKEGKGPSGDNGLYLKFIDKALILVEDGGHIAFVNPPAGLTKTTVKGKYTATMKSILAKGHLVALNLDARAKFGNIGSQICYWILKSGDKQDSVTLTSGGESHQIPVSELTYLPPQFNKVEHDLFTKIMSNADGDEVIVTRDVPDKDYTMTRLGYPKIQEGGTQVLGFDKKHHKFLSSQLGLWLIHYISRHDAFIYHKVLTGIKVPKNGFVLTTEEQELLSSQIWPNMSKKENQND